MIPMKTLTIKGKTYEIIDDKARKLVHSQKEDIRRTCSTAIIQTVEGSPIVVHDSSYNQLLGLRMFGRTTQFATTGAQMFDKDSAVPGLLEVDGSITEDTAHVTSDFIPVTPNTVYYQTQKDSVRTKFYNADKEPISDIWDSQIANSGYFATTDDVYYIRVTVSLACIDAFMLNAGSIGLPYEPYTGGIASPNPDYPQELSQLVDDDSIDIRVESLNLIDASEIEVYANVSVSTTDDKYTITATGGAANPYTSSILSLSHLVESLRGKTVYFAHDFMSNTVVGAKCGAQLNIKRSNRTDYITLSVDVPHREITIPDDVTDIILGIYTNNTDTHLEEDNTVVIEGLRLSLADASWVPNSCTTANVTTLNGLPGIQVGSEWICDEIDFENGMYIQRIKKKVLDGSSETWYKSINDDDNYLYHIPISKSESVGYGPCLCDRLTRKTTDIIQRPGRSMDVIGVFPSPKYNVIYVNIGPYLTENTIEAMSAYLAEHPITIMYGLANPIKIKLSDEDLASYKKLYSVYPASTFLNSVNAPMEVKYNADTKLYLEQLPKFTDEQVQTAINNWLNANLVSAEGVSF